MQQDLTNHEDLKVSNVQRMSNNEDDKTCALAPGYGLFLLYLQRKIVKLHGIMTRNYKHRNEVERYFLKSKHFRKVCTRYDKLDIVFLAIIMIVMIFYAVLCKQFLFIIN